MALFHAMSHHSVNQGSHHTSPSPPMEWDAEQSLTKTLSQGLALWLQGSWGKEAKGEQVQNAMHMQLCNPRAVMSHTWSLNQWVTTIIRWNGRLCCLTPQLTFSSHSAHTQPVPGLPLRAEWTQMHTPALGGLWPWKALFVNKQPRQYESPQRGWKIPCGKHSPRWKQMSWPQGTNCGITSPKYKPSHKSLGEPVSFSCSDESDPWGSVHRPRALSHLRAPYFPPAYCKGAGQNHQGTPQAAASDHSSPVGGPDGIPGVWLLHPFLITTHGLGGLWCSTLNSDYIGSIVHSVQMYVLSLSSCSSSSWSFI